jgi:hypothetical protein
MSTPDSVKAFIESYTPHRGLPPLAGLATFSEAVRPGLSLDESVLRLKRHHYALKRLHQIFISRIASEPIYELKMAFSYHAHLCAEHVSALRARVGEMREPPLGLDKIPDPNLEIFFDEILSSPTTEELILGVYEIAVPTLLMGLRRHIAETHVLADQPSRRICALAALEIQEIADYGRRALKALIDPERRALARPSLDRLSEILSAARDLDGTGPDLEKKAQRFHSKSGFAYDKVPKRDARFPDPYNMGVNAEAFLYDAAKPADAKVLMMFFKRLREIDVPEMMSSILLETEKKPWEYYRDMTRQLWDEARHAMMGEVGFVSLGLEWPKLVMVNSTWSRSLNTQLTPKERHAVLYFIEQGLMPKTGKRHEWEVATMSNNKLSATFQDFDWADEVLHARVGRDWYVDDMPSPAEATHYGDQCWSKVMVDWSAWRKEGLTGHRNWWPALYAAYCENHGLKPDADALNFAQTYENTRADLKTVLPAE